ncbi:MAG: ribose-phosphate pyrophosphokinase [Clostridia bacterium]|nr:ribose-phosphate pyrophosphokinase [Clostridia bacterium]
MADYLENLTTLPFAPLGIIAMPGCEEIGKRIDYYLTNWRKERDSEFKADASFVAYERDTYMIDVYCPRFGSGEAKGVIRQSVRGLDLYIICDVFNHLLTYKMYGQQVPMSPDDHYADLKRIITAIGGKARRITVVMPMLYEGRQHRRTGRESLDCAAALQELIGMGVDSIITFDAHDPRIVNAIPTHGFENIMPTYQMIKALVNAVPEINIDKNHLMIISPDEGAMNRGIYFSSVLGVDLGMFYKRRDYSVVINGRNPIVAHEYLGADVAGKDLIIVDDMISSGDSVLDLAVKLKELKANDIYICTTFGLFCEGLEHFDEAYEKGYIKKVLTTNGTCISQELLEREWFCKVDLSKYIAYVVDTLNHDASISELLDPSTKINKLLAKKGKIK